MPGQAIGPVPARILGVNMQIGPAHWNWISIDSIGVPQAPGMYGNPREFLKYGEPYGFKLAWSYQWQCFFCYSIKPNGELIIEHQFYSQKERRPMPITVQHVQVFRELRELHPNIPLSQALRRVNSEVRYKLEVERQKLLEDMRKDVMRSVDLKRGATPNVMIQVPRKKVPAHVLG